MTATTPDSIVIVGAGLAGATAAKTLRAEGYGGAIRLIGAEPHRPYLRPPLSKGYLAGADDRASLDVEPAEWYRGNDVDLRLGTRVVAIDRGESSVEIATGDLLRYDALLLATGSEPRRLPVPGADLAGVHSLRTVDDSDRLRSELAGGGRRLVLIGSGWIGMEVAATARTLGNDVTILERDPVPLAAALGEELGGFFAGLHTRNGVRIRTSVGVEAIEGSSGRATGVRLADGELVPADLVVIGVGAAPRVALAKEAGIDVEDGVLADASLRSSDPRVFVAGDIAGAYHPIAGRRLRSEHWANAITSGGVAARAMLGQDAVHDSIPYFYTDQFDLGMEYAGFPPLTAGADVVYRGDRDAGEFIAFWVREGRVVAGMNVNVWDVTDAIQALVREGAPVDVQALRDPAVPLDSMIELT